MSYVVGVSSGAFTVTSQEEKPQLVGLFKKAQSAITKGVQFVQLDLESVAEFKEPDLVENIKKVKSMKVRFGVHSETAAFGIEMSEPDSAIQTDYENGHRRLAEILDESRNIEAEYVLIHSSESVPFELLGRHLQPAVLVDVWGRPLRDFIEKEKQWVEKWIIPGEFDQGLKEGGSFMWADLIGGRDLEEYLNSNWEKYTRSTEYEFKTQSREGKVVSEEDKKSIKKNWYENERKDLLNYFLGFIESRSHHYGPERYAYYIIAKWMEKNDDPLWNKIIEANIKFFAAYEGTNPEEWKEKYQIKKTEEGKWSIDNSNFREQYKLWVPAVSAKYIWGHFFQDKISGSRLPDLKEKLKVKKKDGTETSMPLVLESPMAHRGTEEWLRLPNPLQMYCLAEEVNKEAGFEAMGLAVDLEHMISIRIDPEVVAKLLPEEGGKLIRVVHAGWPAPLAPAHLPIQLGSEQQRYLYRVYYQLRQKGFGKDPKVDSFIIFERGGPETFQESILSLRNIVEFLSKDTPPKDLPLEFAGIKTGQIASWERQLTTIKEHAEEPLKGVLAVPEEEHTFLGGAAVAKPGGTEKWKKEEYK